VSNKSIQTLFTGLEQGIQTIDRTGIEIPSGDLINFLESPISSLPQNTSSKLNKFNLEIDLSQVNTSLENINPNELIQMELLDSGIDLSLTEAYIPRPELAFYSDHLVQYLVWT